MSDIALKAYLAPLLDHLASDRVNEVMVNQPGEVIVETPTGKEFLPSSLTADKLHQLAGLIATHTQQSISAQTPLLSASLPGGERVQIVMPPAVEKGQFALSIRKPSMLNLTLNDYQKAGAFDEVKTAFGGSVSDTDRQLMLLKTENRITEFLALAIKARKNILIAGGCSSGKTTFCNALIKLIDRRDRIITIEDVREVQLDHPDRLHLLFSKGGQGQAKVTPRELLEACLRLNPDRIFLNELRGAEAFYFLRAANSGHPGAITTLHANSALEAFDQLVLMVQQAGTNLNEASIRSFLHKVVDVVVQFNKKNGQRIMTELFFNPPGITEPEMETPQGDQRHVV